MSRTLRKIKSYPKEPHGNIFMAVVDESAAKHRKSKWGDKRLRPYVKTTTGMFEGGKFKIREVYSYELGTRVRRRTGPGARLNQNNFNRTLKKGLRQQLKRELRKELETI